MLRAVIVCPNRELRARAEKALEEIVGLSVIRVIDHYPNQGELARFLRAQAPSVVFLSVESVKQALTTHAELESTSPGIQVVAIERTCEPSVLLEVMRAGFREFLAYPFERPLLIESLRRVQEVLDKKPVASDASDLLYSFLPSKAGVGTSTI